MARRRERSCSLLGYHGSFVRTGSGLGYPLGLGLGAVGWRGAQRCGSGLNRSGRLRDLTHILPPALQRLLHERHELVGDGAIDYAVKIPALSRRGIGFQSNPKICHSEASSAAKQRGTCCSHGTSRFLTAQAIRNDKGFRIWLRRHRCGCPRSVPFILFYSAPFSTTLSQPTPPFPARGVSPLIPTLTTAPEPRISVALSV
jgi:hypothetical protein